MQKSMDAEEDSGVLKSNFAHMQYVPKSHMTTVKPVVSGHSRIEEKKILVTNGSLMKVESFSECSPGSIRQYF